MGKIAITFSDQTWTRTADGTRTLGVIGPVSDANASVLRQVVASTMDAGPPGYTLGVDLSCCTGISPGGLHTLVTIRTALRGQGGDLQLLKVPPLLARHARQRGFGDLLT
jgi:anti-anti-sigma regulatory factor